MAAATHIVADVASAVLTNSLVEDEDMFSIIDVCSNRQLFDTFRDELLRAPVFSFALAVDRDKQEAERGVDSPAECDTAVVQSMARESSSSSSDVCRVDSGLIGEVNFISRREK